MEGYLFFCVSCVSRFAKNRKQQAGSAKKKKRGTKQSGGKKDYWIFSTKKSLAFLLACQAKQNGCVLVVQKESKRLLHIFTTAIHKQQQQQQQSRGRNGKEREKLQLTAPLPFSNTSTTPPGMEPQHEDVPPPTYRSFTR